jgi:hypothetical protein
MVAVLRQSDVADPTSEVAPMAAVVATGAWIAGEHEWKGRLTRRSPAAGEGRHTHGVRADVLQRMPPLPELVQGLESLVG